MPATIWRDNHHTQAQPDHHPDRRSQLIQIVALQLLMSSYTALGFREHMTPIWLGLADSSTSMAVLMASHPGIAKSVAIEMAELYENAKDVVRRRRAAIAMVAQLLLERRVLSGNDVKAIVERFPPAKLPELQEGDERCLLRPIERSD